jgi:hypothetical protein
MIVDCSIPKLTKTVKINGTVAFICDVTVPVDFDENDIALYVDITDDFENDGFGISHSISWEVEED